MTLTDSIQRFRLRVVAEAARSGNVSATCRQFGISRTQFSRWRHRFERYGVDGLHPKRRRAQPGRPSGLTVVNERRVIAEALAWPTRGPRWVSDRLAPQGLRLPPTTVWRVLRRHGLGTRRDRLAVLDQQRAGQTGLLTERTRRQVSRHVVADRPGDLCSLDTFSIGTLKGVGKVWPLTACEAASSYGWARVVSGEVTAAAMAACVREVVVPSDRAAGWRLRRVLTDNGRELQGLFARVCAAQQIRHTRTRPRHAWTNGFVERLQATILHHEHWRIAFRRQYFTSLRQLERSLEGFLAFSNTQRPHQGYRLPGQTPATAFAGVVAA